MVKPRPAPARARAPVRPASDDMPVPAPPQPPSDPRVASFMTIVDRLESIVESETGALKRNMPAKVAETGQRKRQGMLDLGRAMRGLAKESADPRVQERLARFSTALEDNRRTLDVHLRAVRDVAEVIAKSMREQESDGTYCRLAGRR